MYNENFPVNLLTSTFGNMDEITTIKKEIKFIQHKYSEKKLFDGYIPLYPDSVQFKKSIVIKEFLKQEDLNVAFYWISHIIPKYKLFNSSIYQVLKDMDKGDDWLVGFLKYKNEFIQVVDSRNLTIFVLNDKPTKVILLNAENILKVLTENINEFGLSVNGGNIKISIRYKDDEIVYGDIVSGNRSDDYISKYRINLFLISSKIKIFQISKVNHPASTILDPFKYKRIFGGIPINDQRKFQRFTGNSKINWDVEIKNKLPDLDDSLKIWLKNAFPLSADLDGPIEIKGEKSK